MKMKKMRAALSSSKGFVDLQSVMVGVIISAIIAGTAIVSVLGITRMVGDDTSKTTLSTLATGLESFYTDKDRYPSSLTELVEANYVPTSYKNMPKTEICYVPKAGTYPQSYVVTTKSTTTGRFFAMTMNTGKTPELVKPTKVGKYPYDANTPTATGTVACP